MSTTITLDRLWLNPVDDLTEGMGFRLAAASLVQAPQLSGEVRQYGGGRLKAATTTTIAQQLPPTLLLDTRDEEAAIEAWQGRTVCVRDPKGRKYYAVYFNPQITEYPGLDMSVVTLTLDEVTQSEAV